MNDYELPPHRYRELKHFCLQYPAWKEEYERLSGAVIDSGDVTGRVASKRKDLEYAMKLIETTAADIGIWGKYVFSYACYDELICDLDLIRMDIRKFYWLLDKRKGV